MHSRINILHVAVRSLFTWTLKCTFCPLYIGHWENLILSNLKEKTTSVATDIFDEFGSGENQRLMKSEKELLIRMGKY